MAVILLMNISISESKLVHLQDWFEAKPGVLSNFGLGRILYNLCMLAEAKPFMKPQTITESQDFSSGATCCIKGLGFINLLGIYLLLFFCSLSSSVISPPPAHTSLLAQCFWSSLSFLWSRVQSFQLRLKELYQHYQLDQIQLASSLLFKDDI